MRLRKEPTYRVGHGKANFSFPKCIDYSAKLIGGEFVPGMSFQPCLIFVRKSKSYAMSSSVAPKVPVGNFAKLVIAGAFVPGKSF